MSNPYTTEDWKAFVRRIAERPEDETPRLVAADWIEEAGDPERGELIRVQCELAGKPGHNHGGHGNGMGRLMETCPQCRLAARSRELLDANEPRWGAGLPFDVEPAGGSPFGIAYWIRSSHATWKRGFVHTARTNWPDWRDHGDAILEQHPVEVVTLIGLPELRAEDRAGLRQQWVFLEGVGRVHMPYVFSHRELDVSRGREPLLRAARLDLLGRVWPADPDRPRIRFELPEASPWRNYTAQYADLTREELAYRLAEARVRAAADALAEHPGDRSEWLTEAEAPRTLRDRPLPPHYLIHHQCPADGPRPTLGVLLSYPYPIGVYRTVELALRADRITRRGYLLATLFFYAGRCADCSTTFLLEARERP